MFFERQYTLTVLNALILVGMQRNCLSYNCFIIKEVVEWVRDKVCMKSKQNHFAEIRDTVAIKIHRGQDKGNCFDLKKT